MSNHWDTNFLPNSYFGRIHFSRLSADNGIASQNGNTGGTYYHAHNGSRRMSAVSEHPAVGPLETQPEYAWVSTVQCNKISVRLTYFSMRLIATKQITISTGTSTLHRWWP